MLIEKDPTDIEGLQMYVNALESEEKQEKKFLSLSPSKSSSNLNRSRSGSRQSIPF
jgi:hypothetical protein